MFISQIVNGQKLLRKFNVRLFHQNGYECSLVTLNGQVLEVVAKFYIEF